jgi:hypothetical protein
LSSKNSKANRIETGERSGGIQTDRFGRFNIGLMPGLVSSYKQGGAWKQAQVGEKFSQFISGPQGKSEDQPHAKQICPGRRWPLFA